MVAPSGQNSHDTEPHRGQQCVCCSWHQHFMEKMLEPLGTSDRENITSATAIF